MTIFTYALPTDIRVVDSIIIRTVSETIFEGVVNKFERRRKT